MIIALPMNFFQALVIHNNTFDPENYLWERYRSSLEIIILISFDWRAKPFLSKNVKNVVNWNHLIDMLQLFILQIWHPLCPFLFMVPKLP